MSEMNSEAAKAYLHEMALVHLDEAISHGIDKETAIERLKPPIKIPSDIEVLIGGTFLCKKCNNLFIVKLRRADGRTLMCPYCSGARDVWVNSQ